MNFVNVSVLKGLKVVNGFQQYRAVDTLSRSGARLVRPLCFLTIAYKNHLLS